MLQSIELLQSGSSGTEKLAMKKKTLILRKSLTALLLPKVLFIYTTILRLNLHLALDRSTNFVFKKYLAFQYKHATQV